LILPPVFAPVSRSFSFPIFSLALIFFVFFLSFFLSLSLAFISVFFFTSPRQSRCLRSTNDGVNPLINRPN
jgi:hypothetical protein